MNKLPEALVTKEFKKWLNYEDVPKRLTLN